MTTETQQPFAEWCIVELLGHRRLAGHLQEVQLAGAGFLRLDIPAADRDPARTQYIAPGSVYALHPVTEATARAAARQWRPEPVSRWELTALAGFPNPPYETAGAVACTEDDMSYHGDDEIDEEIELPPIEQDPVAIRLGLVDDEPHRASNKLLAEPEHCGRPHVAVPPRTDEPLIDGLTQAEHDLLADQPHRRLPGDLTDPPAGTPIVTTSPPGPNPALLEALAEPKDAPIAAGAPIIPTWPGVSAYYQ